MKPSPERATLERQGKRKAEADGKRNKTSGGGGRQKHLNQPDTAKTNINLSTQRAKPTWRKENARTHEKGTHGELVYDMMLPHYRASFPSLGSTACIHVNPIDGYQCSDKFRAQLNLTEKPKGSDHTCKACPVTCSCQNGCGNALELHWKRRLLSWHPAMHNGRKERWCQAQRPAVSTITRPTCETMKKWPAVHST